MTLNEQVFAQALLLAGDLEETQTRLLEMLCTAAVRSLTARMRDGITPEDCKADFIAAASLYGISALKDAEENSSVEEFRAGDLTVRKGGVARDAASRCLERQAEMIILPYL